MVFGRYGNVLLWSALRVYVLRLPPWLAGS